MELSFKRVAKNSTLSGETFAEGEIVESFLFRGEDGELERADLRSTEVVDWEVPASVVCRWRHKVREREDADAASRKQSLATAEEMFIGLIEPPKEESAEGETGEPLELGREALVLVNLLALMLERRRVLKPQGRVPGTYRYMPEKRTVRVPQVELDPVEIVPLIEDLEALL